MVFTGQEICHLVPKWLPRSQSVYLCFKKNKSAVRLSRLICYNAVSLQAALFRGKNALTTEDVYWCHVTFVKSVFSYLFTVCHAQLPFLKNKKNKKNPRLVRMKPWQRFAVTF